MQNTSKFWKRFIIFVVVVAILIGGYIWFQLFRKEAITYDDPAEHFKYASIGLEPVLGLPYPIWKAMPNVCSDLLPDPSKGWLNFGVIQEPGAKLPVGLSQSIIGMERVALNCATCHAGSYRENFDSEQVIVMGAPPATFDLQAYTRFLGDCAQSKNFTPATLVEAMQLQGTINWHQALLYRLFVVNVVKKTLLEIDKTFAWFDTRPDHGPGRVDTFGQAKYRVMMLPDDGHVGTVDFTSVWRQRDRDGHWQHWDGNNNNYKERNIAVSVAVSGGAPVDEAAIERVGDYLWNLAAPEYPFYIDETQLVRGYEVFQQACANCHSIDGDHVGQVVDIEYINTDRGRLDAFSHVLMDNIANLTADDTPYVQYYQHYRKTNGYVNHLLDAIWLQAPYLHNGSVPTLRDLLNVPEARPVVFYRGLDVIDQLDIGFVSSGPHAQAQGFKFDTRLPGNHNTGHLYGTDLPNTDKAALLEYMKTL